MEIIMISDSKIKVMLNADDLKGFDLDTSSLDYSNTETKRMFWDILSRANVLSALIQTVTESSSSYIPRDAAAAKCSLHVCPAFTTRKRESKAALIIFWAPEKMAVCSLSVCTSICFIQCAPAAL